MKQELPAKTVAIGITTFLRNECLYRCVASVQKFYPRLRIYIVEQGRIDSIKQSFYRKLKSQGHIVWYLPFDSGISKARKILKDIVREPYLLYVEDDFFFSEVTDIYPMYKILDSNKDIGIIGGNLINNINVQSYASYEYVFCKMNDTLFYIPCKYLLDNDILKWQQTDNYRFHYADIVLDFSMWKKEVDNIFDENVKIIEHSHSYLLLMNKTNWKVAFTPHAIAHHVHLRTNKEYNDCRSRREDIDYIKKYWNIDNFIWLDKVFPASVMHYLKQRFGEKQL